MIITRCPECHARFRVTDGQLRLAQGQVRCGACLSVFDARAHAQPESSLPEAACTAEAPAAPEVHADRTPAALDTPPNRDSAAEPPPPESPDHPAEDTPAPATSPFTAEPIAFHRLDADTNPLASAGWLLASVLALLLLAAQLLWFERASLARYPQLASLYALLCEQVDCALPYNVLSLIDNRGLHLEPHPQFRDALSARILLENRAPFSQPWPGLRLSFTDLKGRPVAQRTFQPEEYLDTAVIDPHRMPSGQPVQIELELASPGRRGVSYALELAPAVAPR